MECVESIGKCLFTTVLGILVGTFHLGSRADILVLKQYLFEGAS